MTHKIEPRQSVCKGCGAAIIWTVNFDTGRKMPIDPKADPSGNLLVFFPPSSPAISRVAAPEQRTKTQALYTSHFATCPVADKMRRMEKEETRQVEIKLEGGQ